MRNVTRRPLADRFWENVSPEPNSGCWLWTGSTKRGGYGQIGEGGRGGRNLSAHHVSLILHGTPVPDGAVVLHRCDVPYCVNPDHLKVGTQLDNLADMWRKQRHSRGERHSLSLRGRPCPARAHIGPKHWNFGNRKMQCKHGHNLSGENVFIGSDGSRRCRVCRNERSRIAMRTKYQPKTKEMK